MSRFRLHIISVLAIFLLAARAHAQQPPAKDRLEGSVDRGVAFLALLQEKDGAWQGLGQKHPAISSLAVLAFLSAGHVPGEGPYQAHVEKGIRWIMQQQDPSGLFGAPGVHEMYEHGICTLALAEAAAMTDAKTSREIKPKLEKAVKLILQAQRTENNVYKGGWRYQRDSQDADISITGWQIMALRAARNLGCDVPAERIDLAMQFIQQCREPHSRGFSYMPGANATPACTGTCVLVLELGGKHHAHESLQAGSYLINAPLKYQDQHFFYSAYYTSQAMFQLGNNYWNIYRPRLYKELLDNQQRNGGWINNDRVGASYNTAMAILALTVEYRYLPIYQRDEDADSQKQ
jgi:prenyltransferase beta subunit